MAEMVAVTTITITRELWDAPGDEHDQIDVQVEGDDHLTLLLGMLEMAKDTLMRDAMGDNGG